MAKNLKLELNWIGKDQRPRLEPRILLEDPELSHHAEHRVSPDDIFDNRLIFGDNLLALKALEQEFAGKIKCIYIDPPYNTGNAFEHYDDGIEHSLWLQLMRDRLVILRRLLRPDGFLCCHIDDSEGHYLKVLLDEVFGRPNYVTTFYILVRYAQKTLKQDMAFHKQVEYVHIYRREYGARPSQPSAQVGFEKFPFHVEEKALPRSTIVLGGKKVEVFAQNDYIIKKGTGSRDGLKEIWATGTILDGNSSGRFFRDYLSGRVTEDGLGALYKVYGIGDDQFEHRYFTGPNRAGATKGKYFQGVPTAQLDSDATERDVPIENFYDMAGSFGNCRLEGGVDFRGGKKPEALLEKILSYFSNAGDWVLDSFAGSGTTGAVAHKMSRRWIMVELGDHAKTLIVPRMRKVIDGKDLSGVTEAADWKGGGGFRFLKLAPSLIRVDKWGNAVINTTYNGSMLAEAVCKLEGFTYAPSESSYWQQGCSTERDFIYVTTQKLTREQLQALSDEVGQDRTLLVCCASFRTKADAFPNLTIKKIPHAVLSRCEWGHDDYSLQIENLSAAPDFGFAEEFQTKAQKGKAKKVAASSLPLFDTSQTE
jgi:adenine-specific DNA-methyltransferase